MDTKRLTSGRGKAAYGLAGADSRDERLLRDREVAKLCGISRRHFRNLVAAGVAPAGVRLGTSRRWDRLVIENWLDRLSEGVGHVN